MAHTSVIANTNAAALGASDVLVYRRASGGQFVLTGPADLMLRKCACPP